MQNQQNLPAYPNDNSELGTTSPVKKRTGESKLNTFKSPLTSAKKRPTLKLTVNDENIEPEQNNPFSGPVFAPNPGLAKSKSSPITLTPTKTKEGHHGDFMGARDQNMGLKLYESPFSKYCSNLVLSPAPRNLFSPSPLHPNLQYNFSYGNIHNNHFAYSPIHDHKESPAFKRNITKIDFNPSNNIVLNTHKEKVNIESDDIDHLELHNSHLYEDSIQPTYFNKFFSNQSIYGNSMVPSQNLANEDIFDKSLPNSSRKARYSSRRDEEDSEETSEKASAVQEKYLPLRTPSPQSHANPNLKLETINSFSNPRKTLTTQRDNTAREPRGYDNSGSQGSVPRGGRLQAGVEFLEPPSSAKPKKKVCCNCKKSRCLKLYCDCFGRGEPCSKECNCVNCYNNDQHHKERQEAMDAIREKNPSAFKPKIDRTDSPEKVVAEEIDQGRVRHMKGCNCKKSGCQKKYCECYQAGIQCTEMCKCENCKNMDSCCRFKRAERYGLQNFGRDPQIHQMIVPETTVYKRNSQYLTREDEENDEEQRLHYHNHRYPVQEEMDPRWRSQAQNRHRDQQYIQDQSYYSEVPTKKRKSETTTYEYTPKRTLVYPKDDDRDQEDTEEYLMQKMEKGYDHFATPHANMDKKRSVKMEKLEDYTPSPGKFNQSAKRAKRNVKLYSQFDPEEYELTK